jgi:hypothetical protein
MKDHVKILGIVHIVFGALGIVVGLFFLGIFVVGGTFAGMAAQQDPDAVMAGPVLGLIGAVFFGFMLLVSVPGIIAGWGLLQMRPWARILTIVLSALNLLNIPIGTAVGIYGLWVLLNTETERMFATVGAAGG